MSEKTKEQTTQTQIAATGGGISLLAMLNGTSAPAPGTFQQYRRMRSNPTVALARAVATAPIRGAEITYKGKSKNAAKRVKELVGPLVDTLVNDMLYALDYGFKAFELVWTVEGGFTTFEKIKPLNVELTEAIIDGHGNLTGLKQDKIKLSKADNECFWYTYDGEDGYPYGRARNENIRSTAYHAWCELLRQQFRYVEKVAGIIPLVEYPEGESRDAGGRTASNFDIAQMVLKRLGQGDGVAMPNALVSYAMELLRVGVPVDKVRAWNISFLQPPAAYNFANDMRHHEAGIMRGWLVPERAATEGQMGTKAESAEHASVAVATAQFTLNDILSNINKGVIQPWLAVNGYKKDDCYLDAAPADEEARASMRKVMENALSTHTDLLTKWAEIEEWFEMLGWPHVADLEQEAIEEEGAKPAAGATEIGATDELAKAAKE